MKKGQALTHTLVVGFGVILLLSVIVILNTNKLEYQKFIIEKELEELCLTIKSSIYAAYVETDYHSNDVILGRVRFNLPSTLVDSKYRISLADKSVFITTESPRFEHTCFVGINAEFKGATNGGQTEIIYSVNDGSEIIEMVKI
ncbi:hypothetical protein ACFLQN_02480 [Candidatus Aenigmatarchaeota archaeon]